MAGHEVKLIDPRDRGGKYGRPFDDLVERWRVIENEHDKQHPDRGQCGGVGHCSMMSAAVRLEHEMIEALTEWRARNPS